MVDEWFRRTPSWRWWHSTLGVVEPARVRGGARHRWRHKCETRSDSPSARAGASASASATASTTAVGRSIFVGQTKRMRPAIAPMAVSSFVRSLQTPRCRCFHWKCLGWLTGLEGPEEASSVRWFNTCSSRSVATRRSWSSSRNLIRLQWRYFATKANGRSKMRFLFWLFFHKRLDFRTQTWVASWQHWEGWPVKQPFHSCKMTSL